ncbi:MAG: hypothetical protein DRJ38_06430 [Thermoprotei archaeon]|nr:MAG: hypothetical protein DRJ38_06430 [Thermoprotei archaeon]
MLIKFGLYTCRMCGFTLGVDNNEDFLDYLRNLILREREKEKDKVRKEVFRGEVLNVSGNLATIETFDINNFIEGDTVAIVQDSHIEPIGVVIIEGSREFTINLFSQAYLNDGEVLDFCKGEVLIGYDLQINLIDRIKKGDLSIKERKVIELVFKHSNLGSIRKVKIFNIKDVKEEFILDEYQIEAVESILGLKDGELLLIVGPPGTGKTRVIAKAALELANSGEKVLITSHTNRAVDNAIELLPLDITLRIGRPEKITPKVRKYLLSYKAKTALGKKLEKIDSEIEKLKNNLVESLKILKDYKEYGLYGKVENIRRRIFFLKAILRKKYLERNEMLRNESNKIVEEAKIIGSTLIKSQLPPLSTTRFNTVLLDESSQASVTLALLGMLKGDKWVLIGDHRQLLPIFKTIKDDNYELIEKLSSFTSLKKKYSKRVLWLKKHYRSNPDIIGFSRKYIYEEDIVPADSCKSIKLEIEPIKYAEYIDPEKPVVFIHINGRCEMTKDKSRINMAEVEVVNNIVDILKACGVESSRIGIISPYRAQIAEIRRRIDDKELEIGTVDSFQGREKDVIIFSVTATGNLKFVVNPNRLNVAFTRARKKLIVLGNIYSILSFGDSLLLKFLEYVDARNGIYNWIQRKWISLKILTKN